MTEPTIMDDWPYWPDGPDWLRTWVRKPNDPDERRRESDRRHRDLERYKAAMEEKRAWQATLAERAAEAEVEKITGAPSINPSQNP
jgi:hypothetical protein